MYYLCVDGSGQTKIKQNTQDNGLYVLSGVLIHEKDWESIEKMIVDVKENLFPGFHPNEWEMHASDIWHCRNFFDKKELALMPTKRYEIFSKIVDIVCKSKITIINVIVFKDLLKQKSYPAVMKFSWRRLAVRFEDFLAQNNIPTNHGLFLVDASQKAPETEIKNVILNEVCRQKSKLGNSHVIEIPIFVDSSRWNMIQLVDVIAYIVHKHYKNDSQFERWFNLLNSKMYRSDGALYGFGINEIPDSR